MQSQTRKIPATYPYLTKVPGVRGGSTIIEGTRIGVHDVIGLLQNGETVDTLVTRCFPDLTRAQVYECLAYYEDHRGEIDLLVARQTAPWEAVRFLFDHDVPDDLRYVLNELGHSVTLLREVMTATASDAMVLNYAVGQELILIL